MNQSKKGRVAVAMSGGVDSSVTAALLKQQGYDVFGITMRVTSYAPEQMFKDAAQVAAHIGIPHHILDLCDPFRESVLNYFVEEYRKGRTPNPCARCNPAIKFGLLLDKALEMGADYLATGHYAKVEQGEDGLYRLEKGVYDKKDQSYFLFTMTQARLSKILFPLGGLIKPAVRKLAADFGLSVVEKAESQEICFIPDNDYIRYLEETGGISGLEGEIVTCKGEVVGRHSGIHRYTIGQRRGLGIAYSEPLYVLGINAAKKEVTVGTLPELYRNGLIAKGFNWIIPSGSFPFNASCKIRYRHKEVECEVSQLPDGDIKVSFSTPEKGVTPGQAVVIYEGDTVLGGGWIEEALQEC